MKFLAYKEHGKLTINWDRVEVYLSKFPDGTRFDVEIVRRQKTKSDPLRAYYFVVVLPLFMAHLGYEKDEHMGGIIGRLFKEFAVTIGVAVLISGFIALTLTPMLSSRFLSQNTKGDSGGSHAKSGKAFELLLSRGTGGGSGGSCSTV